MNAVEQKPCILVIDDTPENLSLMSELLREDYQVKLAPSGERGLQISAADPQPDLILLDIMMPGMDGYQVMQQLQAHKATREIRQTLGLATLPILAMTANAMAGDREKVLAAGMNDHIAKPLQIGPMFATISKWFCPAGPVSAPASQAVEDADDASTPVDLDTLPGIDAKVGMAGTMNNAALYRRLLASFSRSNLDFTNVFRSSWPDDAQLAVRMAHTLKGTAGTIGASAVQHAAAELERACRDADALAEVGPLLADVERELHTVLDGLQAFGDASDQPGDVANPATLQPPLPVAEVERFKALLANSDADALPLMAELSKLARGTQWQATFDAASRELDAFLFDEAFERLSIFQPPDEARPA